jgi:hypothetical protein
MTPRRYRLALRACPATYRDQRGAEILCTLEDGDRDRGHPTIREALALARRGIALRCSAEHAAGPLAALGFVIFLAALCPDGWWAHRPAPGLEADTAFGPHPPILRLLMAAAGLVAIFRAAPRSALLIAAAAPYGLLVAADLQMAYGRASFSVAADQLPGLFAVTCATLAGLLLARRAITHMRPERATMTIALAIAAPSLVAVLATIDAVGRPLGSGGPGYPLAPNLVGDFGPATIACAMAFVTASIVAVQAIPKHVRRTT